MRQGRDRRIKRLRHRIHHLRDKGSFREVFHDGTKQLQETRSEAGAPENARSRLWIARKTPMWRAGSCGTALTTVHKRERKRDHSLDTFTPDERGHGVIGAPKTSNPSGVAELGG